MNDSTRRTIRAGIDVILTLLTGLLASLAYPGLPELIDSWTAPGIVTAATVVLGALFLFFSKVRNALEDNGKVPAFLKAPPSPGVAPIPDPYERRRPE